MVFVAAGVDMVHKGALMSSAISSPSIRLSGLSRWKSFKFRRRLMQLPTKLFFALPTFLKFLIQATRRSLKHNKHSFKTSWKGGPVTTKEEKRESASKSSRGISNGLPAFTKSGESIGPSSLRKLDSQELAYIESLAKEKSGDEVLLVSNNEGVSEGDLLALLTGQWLNSDIVNTYFSLLKLRFDRLKSRLPSECGNLSLHQMSDNQKCRLSCLNSYFFTSFWYTKYMQSGYLGVVRWTKGIDLRTYDCLFFPINVNNLHWVLVAVHISSGVIEYYDSLSSTSFRSVTATISDYLNKEALRNNWNSSDLKQWKLVDVCQIPRQVDTSNCGVYMCIYADLLSKGARPPFAFSHKDMDSIRLGMAADLVRGFVNDI